MALTRGRVTRLANEQGWDSVSPTPGTLRLQRGEAKIWLWFASNGALKAAIHHRPGHAEKPTRGKLAYVVGWLTGDLA